MYMVCEHCGGDLELQRVYTERDSFPIIKGSINGYGPEGVDWDSDKAKSWGIEIEDFDIKCTSCAKDSRVWTYQPDEGEAYIIPTLLFDNEIVTQSDAVDFLHDAVRPYIGFASAYGWGWRYEPTVSTEEIVRLFKKTDLRQFHEEVEMTAADMRQRRTWWEQAYTDINGSLVLIETDNGWRVSDPIKLALAIGAQRVTVPAIVGRIGILNEHYGSSAVVSQ